MRAGIGCEFGFEASSTATTSDGGSGKRGVGSLGQTCDGCCRKRSFPNGGVIEAALPVFVGLIAAEVKGLGVVHSAGDGAASGDDAIAVISERGSVFDDGVVNPSVLPNGSVVDVSSGSAIAMPLELIGGELDKFARAEIAAGGAESVSNDDIVVGSLLVILGL